MTPPLLELRDVTVTRGGVQVLDVPRFQLDEGETVALVGPNGAGKSTLLLALMGLVERRGELRYRGRAVRTRREALECRRRIAMVLQEPLLFDATVRANVASGLELRGVPRRERAGRVLAALERLGIAALAERSARRLSGGEARRVSLARALAIAPDALFLDEPFANLDAPTRQAIADDLGRTIAAAGTAAILVTHDAAEAFQLARRVVVMDGGRIVQSGAPAELMRAPASAFVAHFAGIEALAEGVVTRRDGARAVIAVASTEIVAAADVAVGERVTFGVRPAEIRVAPARPAARDGHNVVVARLAGASPVGPFLRLRLDGPVPLTAYVVADTFALPRPDAAAEVYASFDPAAVVIVGSH